MNLVESIEPSADRWMDELIALRRKIHEHPELAFEEHETAKRVQEFLAQARHSLPHGHRRDGHRRVACGRASPDRRSRSVPTWTRCR